MTESVPNLRVAWLRVGGYVLDALKWEQVLSEVAADYRHADDGFRRNAWHWCMVQNSDDVDVERFERALYTRRGQLAALPTPGEDQWRQAWTSLPPGIGPSYAGRYELLARKLAAIDARELQVILPAGVATRVNIRL
jgi:hypothetical protein